MRFEGNALYYDGRSSRGSGVRFLLDLSGLTIATPDGTVLATWPTGRLRRADSAPGMVRLAAEGEEDARLEVSDPALVAAMTAALRAVPGPDAGSWSGILKVGGWLGAAMASLAALVWWGIPYAADRIAPLVPVSIERQVGESVKPQILTALGSGGAAEVCRDAAGLAALKRMTEPMLARASTPLPIDIEVVDVKVPNAFALPGGHVLVMRGLIDKVETADELAGVIAHEIGHVVHRDAMRGVLKSAGLSLLAGLVIGDFTGSTIAIAVGRTLIDAGYSRDAESMADAYAVELMGGLGRDPAALGSALKRITGDEAATPGILSWLSTHPDTATRAATLSKASPRAAPGVPLLSAADWAALKGICRKT